MIKKLISVIGIFLPSYASRLLFRAVGFKVGKNTKIPFFSYISANQMEIGDDVDIRPFVYIKVNKLTIGHNTIVSTGSQIKGEHNFYTKGNNFIGAHCIINCDQDVRMGFYSGLGPRSIVYTHGSFLPTCKGYPAKFQEVVIEDYVWVAMAVTIMPGTRVESNCIISPGVVLASRIKSNSIIELKSGILSVNKLSLLQRFLKNKGDGDLVNIVRQFLEHKQIEFDYDTDKCVFHLADNSQYKVSVDSSEIEFICGSDRVRYDLDKFCVDYSKLKTHQDFLFHLRRRCGIILRTNYSV